MILDRPLLFLIGYRGTGKSTVGRLLAERLGWEFVDADEELEKRHGRTISAIVAEEGEAGFRAKEATVLVSLCNLSQHVVATGGGVILRENNRQLLRMHGRVAWLSAGPDTIGNRLQNDPNTRDRRPNLGVGGRTEIEECLLQRDPLYRSCADYIVSTESGSPDDVANHIMNMLSSAPDFRR